MRRWAAIAALVAAALMPGCNGGGESIAGNDNEGSITVTVGIVGVMVDSLGGPVEGALLKARAADSTEYAAVSGARGEYIFKELAHAAYSVTGTTPDSGLVVYVDSVPAEMIAYGYDPQGDSALVVRIAQGRDSIDVPPDSVRIDTMRAPGTISGRVMLDTGAVAGVQAYVPGTSYDAWTGDSGRFVISGVPPGVYTVVYRHDRYLAQRDTAVVVRSGMDTPLPPRELVRDPDGPPPAPSGVRAEYDTLHGAVAVTWEPVEVADIGGYIVYVGEGENLRGRSHILSAPPYTDTLFTGFGDTLSRRVWYQVKAVDTLGNPSGYSARFTVDAASPGWLRTWFTWEMLPSEADTVTTTDSFTVVVSFVNRTRVNETLSWYLGPSHRLVRRVAVNATAGTDTLRYLWPDTGTVYLQVSARTRDSLVWRDSTSISIRDSSVVRPRNVWTGDQPSLRVPRRNLAAVVVDDTLYAIGGCADQFNSRPSARLTVETRHVNDSVWSSGPELPAARYDFATAVSNGHIYVLGGTDFSSFYRSVDVYDPGGGSWSAGPALGRPLSGAAACALGDSILLFGGMTERNHSMVVSDSIFVYDPSAGTCTAVGRMNQPRAYHRAVVCRNNVYVLGGVDHTNTPLTSVEVFDPATGAISQVQPMGSPRFYFGAAVVDNRIYAVGGFGSTSAGLIHASTERYDPTTDTWESRASMPRARHGFGVCVYDRMIYVIGGSESSQFGAFGQVGTVGRYYP